MKCNLQHSTVGLVFVLCCFLAIALPAGAETDSDQDGWKFGGSAYLWAAGIEGKDAAGRDIDVPFTDLLGSLDGGLMGIISAQKGRWTLIADFLYLSISDEASSIVDVEMKGYVSTFGVAYRVLDDNVTSFDLMAGARYFYLDLDLDVDVGGSKIKYSDSEDVLDGIIGGQVLIDLSDKWYLSCYADIGAGDSKLTWQVWPGVGYRLGKVDLVAGYRYLAWETDNGDTIDNIKFSGPMLGIKFTF